MDALVAAHALGPIDATVTLPGSKSYTNRALLLAALAEGQSTLHEALFSEDTDAMAESLRRLGIDVSSDPDTETFVVQGRAGTLPASCATLDVGASGTTARFLAGLLPLGHGVFHMDGVARMRERPMAPLFDALRSLGADIRSLGHADCLPVEVHASGFRGGATSMPGDQSSQFFTALLLPAAWTSGGVDVEVKGELVSKPYLDVTTDVMSVFGIEVTNDDYQRFSVPGRQHYAGIEYHVEPDASAASYFFAAAALTGGRVRVRNLTSRSPQGDVRFVDVLERMGATVQRGDDFIEVLGPSTLCGVDVDMNQMSDTVQTLAAIAPFASEPVIIRNVGHIRLKETDRIAALATELRRLGAAVEENADALVIQPSQLHADEVQTYDDHRMAMSFAVAGLRVPGLRIADPDCVRKTFPDFFVRFSRMLAPEMEVA